MSIDSENVARVNWDVWRTRVNLIEIIERRVCEIFNPSLILRSLYFHFVLIATNGNLSVAIFVILIFNEPFDATLNNFST